MTAADGTYRLGAPAGNWMVTPLTEKPVAEQPVTIAESQTSTLDFIVDVTPPAFAINAVASPTNNSSQTVSGTMEVGSTIAISINTSATVGLINYPTSTTWSCTISNFASGVNILTVIATDSSGNSSTATAQIKYSKDLSATGSILINGGATYSKSPGVTLTLTCTDNAGPCKQMQFSNDGSIWSSAVSYSATRNWTLSSGDGQKTVYARFKDAVGTWSEAVSSSIVLDSTRPVTAVSPAGGKYNSAQSIVLSCTDTGVGCDKIYYTTDGTLPTTSSQVYSAPVTMTGTFKVRYFSTDLAGNTEVAKSQSYTIDAVAATGSILINGGAAYSKSSGVTLTLTCTDNAGSCKQMQLSNDGVSWSSASAFLATRHWNLSSGDGSKTVYARFKDAVGTWSEVVSSTIVLDSTRPVTTVSPAGGKYNSAQSIVLSCTDTGVGCDKIYYTTDGTLPTTSSQVYSAPVEISVTSRLKYFSTDLAGNAEGVKSQNYVIEVIKEIPKVQADKETSSGTSDGLKNQTNNSNSSAGTSTSQGNSGASTNTGTVNDSQPGNSSVTSGGSGNQGGNSTGGGGTSTSSGNSGASTNTGTVNDSQPGNSSVTSGGSGNQGGNSTGGGGTSTSSGNSGASTNTGTVNDSQPGNSSVTSGGSGNQGGNSTGSAGTTTSPGNSGTSTNTNGNAVGTVKEQGSKKD